MFFLAEQESSAVQSESYRSAREALATWLEMEAAKQLVRRWPERGRGKSKERKRTGSGGNAVDSEW